MTKKARCPNSVNILIKKPTDFDFDFDFGCVSADSLINASAPKD